MSNYGPTWLSQLTGISKVNGLKGEWFILLLLLYSFFQVKSTRKKMALIHLAVCRETLSVLPSQLEKMYFSGRTVKDMAVYVEEPPIKSQCLKSPCTTVLQGLSHTSNLSCKFSGIAENWTGKQVSFSGCHSNPHPKGFPLVEVLFSAAQIQYVKRKKRFLSSKERRHHHWELLSSIFPYGTGKKASLNAAEGAWFPHAKNSLLEASRSNRMEKTKYRVGNPHFLITSNRKLLWL